MDKALRSFRVKYFRAIREVVRVGRLSWQHANQSSPGGEQDVNAMNDCKPEIRLRKQ